MRKRLYKWLSLFCLVCLTGYAPLAVAAPLEFKNFMSVDGLSDNRVLCAMQDHFGFVWLGTANGLNCFDGQQNMIFRNMVLSGTTFENNQITSLLEQGDDVWFGGSFGLYIYHRADNSFTRFSKTTRYNVLVSSTVDQIMRTQNGLVWICTQGQGLFIYDPQADVLTQDSRHNSFISDMSVGSDGQVYLISLDGHLLIYDLNGNFQQQYDVPDFIVDKNKMSIENVGSRLYIGCDQGLFRLNNETHAVECVAAAPASLTVRALCPYEGSLLVGTDHGIYVYDVSADVMTRIDQLLREDTGLSDDCINGFFTSNDGTLWVLTEHGGANYLPAQPAGVKVKSLPETEGRTHNLVRTFCQTNDGLLWIGSDDGLFVQNSNGDIQRPANLRNNITSISALAADGDDLWIGTENDGLYVLSTTTGELRHYTYSDTRPYTISSNEIYSLLRTQSGDIYVGTSWGLRRYDRQHDYFMFFSQISSMTGFTDLVEDADGTIWAASDSYGLFYKRANEGDFTNLTAHPDDPNSLPCNAITSVACDSNNDIWVAAKGGGLARYDREEGNFEPIGSMESVLQREQIYFLLEDAAKSLWLGMDDGFVRIHNDKAMQTDFLQGITQNQRKQKLWNSAFRTADGIIHVGSNSEIISFNPEKLKNNHLQTKAYITHISFHNNDDNYKDLKRLGLNHLLYIDEAIRLPFGNNHFTLYYTTPHYSGSMRLHYEYMMTGLDKTWIRSTGTNEATYSNLQPGTYEFVLREAGDEVPEHYAHLRITILSPWYRTPWAYAIYALLVASIIFLIYRRTNRLMKDRYEERMEEYRLLQEKENFQSKINFFINLLHEIRTPLSLINLPLEQMEESELSDDNRNHVHSIRRNTNYLLGITNQLLDFQKAENGTNINLQLSTCDVSQLLDDIYRQFKDPMKVEGESLQLQLPATTITTTLDRDKVSKVLMNLLGNALKYARSEVIIRLEQDDEESFSISVIDDGPGVPPAERERIFDAYYQIAGDATAAHLGTGLGLSYAKMQAKAHGGDIIYEDAVGGGSIFKLMLPIRQEETLIPAMKEVEQHETEDAENTENAHQIEKKRSFRILLVEDNEELLRATADGLRKWFFVMKAHDGIEALDVLRHHEVDIIVSDVMMPHMDGNQFCRQVKSDINYSHLPVILLTAKTTVEAKLEGMESGADIYMEKPFSMKQLHLQIESLLRMRQRFYERMRQVDGEQTVPGAEGEFGMNQQDLQFMQRLQELMRQNMRDEQFSIDVLAEQLNMSRSSFYRKIKALTDMTPVDYMKMQRLERAAKLLQQGQRISEVANQVGFTSSSYFAKCFRQKFGMLPKDYVNNLRNPQDDEQTS